MWPKKTKIGGLNVSTFAPGVEDLHVKTSEPGITITENTKVITRRNRTPVDMAKVEVMSALLDVVASEDLDALFVAMLSEVRSRGYNLKDEPEALLVRLKVACQNTNHIS